MWRSEYKVFSYHSQPKVKAKQDSGAARFEGGVAGGSRKDRGSNLEVLCCYLQVRSPPSFEASLSAIKTHVSLDMNDELLAAFKADEVVRAIKQMHRTKSPRPDSMSPIFYQKYWDLVSTDVINCVLNALNNGILSNGLNETFICLIPKVKNPQRITDFRPISLCNVLYKIISKVLANQLK